jgi:hypothetical protein
MWIALAALALIAVAVAIVVLFRRPAGDDIDSVRSYHSALGTLEHLADRTGTSTVTVMGQDQPAGEARVGVARTYRRPDRPSAGVGTGRSVPPVPVRGNDEFPDPEVPLVFDDSRPRDRFRHDGSGESVAVSRTDRAQRHALDSMNHRPRRVTTILVVIAAVVLFGVLAYAGSKRSSPGHAKVAASAPTTTATAAAAHPAPTTSAGHATTVTTRPKPKARPTPTTQPTQVVALSSTSTSATYPVVNSNYTITVTGTGRCWVSVTGGSSSGSTLWAGEVQAGTVQAVPVSGTVTVQLGTPAVTLAVDQVPVVLPTPVQAPFVATFQPTAAALAASPPTTSTTSTTAAAGSSAAGSTVTSSTTPP